MGKRTGYRKPKSARELRRQQNKTDIKYLYEMEISPIARQKEALYKNGITAEDMKREFEKGIKAGRDYAFRLMYAATLLWLIEDKEIDPDDAVEDLGKIDDRITLCIEDTELAEEVYRKYGIELVVQDPLQRIQRTQED